MKKALLILTTAFLASAVNIQAQELDSSKREKLQALKIAYLTRELNLGPEEAQVFWPLYNELQSQMRILRKQKHQNIRSTRENFSEMSDNELSAAIDREFELEQQELDLKREYVARFKNVLPIKKVVRLHGTEEDFRKELLKGARDRRKDGHPGPDGR